MCDSEIMSLFENSFTLTEFATPISSVKKVSIPLYIAEFKNVQSSYAGTVEVRCSEIDYEDVFNPKTQTYEKRITDKYNTDQHIVSGDTIPCRYNNVFAIYAGTSFPKDVVEYVTSNLTPENSSDEGVADEQKLTVVHLREIYKKYIKDREITRIKDDLKKSYFDATNIDINIIHTHISDPTTEKIFRVPVYVGEYKLHGKTLYKIHCPITKKTSGVYFPQPLSYMVIGSAVGVSIGLLSKTSDPVSLSLYLAGGGVIGYVSATLYNTITLRKYKN